MFAIYNRCRQRSLYNCQPFAFKIVSYSYKTIIQMINFSFKCGCDFQNVEVWTWLSFIIVWKGLFALVWFWLLLHCLSLMSSFMELSVKVVVISLWLCCTSSPSRHYNHPHSLTTVICHCFVPFPNSKLPKRLTQDPFHSCHHIL